ncbi:hypothetical protein IAD21_04634 [Abditibacteriota bacterium]|nr:hypothetical protein IAD21_04634 [Abditibacteriota bacterium]
MNPINDQQINRLVQRAEKSVSSSAFLPTRIAGVVSLLLTPLMFVAEIGVGQGIFMAAIGWGLTYLSWIAGKDLALQLKSARAQLIWREIRRSGVLAEPTAQDLAERITQVYEHDLRAEFLPLSQAVRLTLVWKQQKERLSTIEHRVRQMKDLRATLLEKQQLLYELGDDNAALEQTLARLDHDTDALECNGIALGASCSRLESLVTEVNAAARRRQLHREIGELAAQVPLDKANTEPTLATREEHLDLERQITREIETYLQLERETDAHLRDL